jgi:3-hydroxyisobutyrate dehydrogenase
MVGGKENQFQDAQHYLRAMGKNIVHCGDVGTGQVCSLKNALICYTPRSRFC